ncbi:general odorant-binding protein 69a [Macrosteles quadrilineatus]|uniref:general odorant-binding protein 69a n=1 Tax=Macrosteles quadrilineatus TaxID=74068 RepID=UPI0023E0A6B1|nr:general odorant-binding protein 69a [Macrosteles quadrilineatus]
MGFGIFVVFCYVLLIAQAKLNWERTEKFMAMCKAETGAEETMDTIVVKEELPTNPKGMCLIECLLRMQGIYDTDGVYHEDGTKKLLEEYFEESPENVEKVLRITTECSKIDTTGLNKCEAAVKHVACSRKKCAQESIVVIKERS